jgi:hypothetical protein
MSVSLKNGLYPKLGAFKGSRSTLTHEDVTEQKRVEEQIASLIANAT